jgi:ribonuclease HII
MIVGVDEVGRGAIAGDLVVCAAAFRDQDAEGRLAAAGCRLLDSKAFSSRKRREDACHVLLNDAGVIWKISRATPGEIEKVGIHHAVLNCMESAARSVIEDLDGEFDCVFDGKFVPSGFADTGGRSLVKGDSKLGQISAASIIAKVARDREMVELGLQYPVYGFEKHSGYGTAQHIAAIREHGLIASHRSWARKFLENVIQ